MYAERERHCIRTAQFWAREGPPSHTLYILTLLSSDVDRCENAARLYAFIILLVRQEMRGGVKVCYLPTPIYTLQGNCELRTIKIPRPLFHLTHTHTHTCILALRSFTKSYNFLHFHFL